MQERKKIMIEIMFWVNLSLSMSLAMWYGFAGNPQERVGARIFVLAHIFIAIMASTTRG
jgi:hypothetical protein